MIKVALEDVHFKVAVVGRKLGPKSIQHHNVIVKKKTQINVHLGIDSTSNIQRELLIAPSAGSLQPIALQDVMIDVEAGLRTTKRYYICRECKH